MKFSSSLTLMQKFVAIAVLTCLGFAAVGYAFFVLQKEQEATIAVHDAARNLNDLVRQIESGLLRIEAAEREFRHDRTSPPIVRFNNGADMLVRKIDSALALAYDDKERELAARFKQALNSYRSAFAELVAAQTRIGVDPESGLRGELSRSARRLDHLLAQQASPELSLSAALMRRAEQEYFASGGGQHVTRLSQEQAQFSGLLDAADLDVDARAAIEQSINDYATAFGAVVAVNAELAALDESLVETLAATEAALTAFAQNHERLMRIDAAAADAAEKNLMRSFYAALLIISVIVFALLIVMGRSIVRSVRSASQIAKSIAAGNLDNEICPYTVDETGGMLRALGSMQTNLRERIEADRLRSATNGRIRQALDNVNGNVLIADASHSVIYANEAASALFKAAQAQIRSDLPAFDAAQLIGASIDDLYVNADERPNLDDLESTHKTRFRLGGRTFRSVANPVVDEDGERIGVVVELTDITLELAIEEELAHVVESALVGDLSERITLDEKRGFARRLSGAVNQLVDVAEGVVKDTMRVFSSMAAGNLTETIDSDYRGSFDELKQDANATISKLTEVLGRIQESSRIVMTGASEISQGNANLSRRTEEQAMSLEKTASSMQIMTSTVRSNADNASQANELAKAACDRAARGGEVVGDAVQAMEAINEASRRIADIIGVIDEIAFQTNLLALNASVEAARAGEQGRGFAVVASEVRNLAGRSATAAREIKELIEDSGRKVDDGSRLVNESGETLRDIVERVREVTSIVGEIAAASQEQSNDIDNVNRTIVQMDELTQQNAALVEEAAAASESLRDQADSLNQVVTFFSIDASGEDAAEEFVERRAANRPWSDAGSAEQALASAPPAAAVGDDFDGELDWEEF